MRLVPWIVSLGVLVLGFAFPAASVQADATPHDKLKEHIRDIVQEVKAAPSAAEKRSILDERLNNMIAALDRVEEINTLSDQDQSGINAFRSRIQAKLDELHGHNGFEPVPDGQLNSFADYVQQDLEQANATTITISVTTALLILLLIILLA